MCLAKQPWLLRAIAEFVAITTGVLVALAIDTAWQARADRATEQAFLADYADELRSSAELVEVTLRVGATARAELDRARAILDAGLVSDSASAFLAALVEATSFESVPVVSSAVAEDLISSGSIRLIRDPALRREILDWNALLPRLLNLVEWNQRSIEPGLKPVLYRHLPPHTVTRVIRTDGRAQTTVHDTPENRDAIRTAAARLASEPAIAREINAEYGRLQRGLEWVERVQTNLRERLQRFEDIWRASGGSA